MPQAQNDKEKSKHCSNILTTSICSVGWHLYVFLLPLLFPFLWWPGPEHTLTKWVIDWIANGLDCPEDHMPNSMTNRNALKNRLLKTTIHFIAEILWMYFVVFKLQFSGAASLRKGSYEMVGSITGILKCVFYFLCKMIRNNYLSRRSIFPQNETA